MTPAQCSQPCSAPPDAAPRGEITAKYVEEAFGGTGMGNKSLADVATRLHLEVGVMHSRLASKGIEGSETESLKAIATRNGLQPLDVVKAAVIGDFRPVPNP